MGTNLTTSLALLGLAVFLGLAVQAWWRMRREGELRRSLPVQATETERIEPGLAEVVDTVPMDEGPTAFGATSAKRPVRLDALIDAIVPITPDGPISGEMALSHMPASRRAGTKPMHIEGLDAETGEWEPVVHGRRYTEFQAGVQLANRSGALNEIEYSEFVQKVQAFAEGIVAMADFPDMLEVVSRARELDGFASAADAQLSLVLRANGIAWSVGYVQQCAARHGFVPGSLPGRLVMPGAAEGDPPMLLLAMDAQTALADDPQAALREVTLSLDVAQTPESAEPFPAWHRASTALCDDLDATAVDDKGLPVTLHAFDGIGKELGQLYRQLESRDLSAGSPAARRLFS